MKGVLFIARVAFLLNLMFIVYLVSYLMNLNMTNNYVTGFIVTTGFLLPILVNAVFFTILVIRIMGGRSNKGIPLWLLSGNFLLYMAQIVFFAFS